MKRKSLLFLTIIFLIFLCACGNNEKAMAQKKSIFLQAGSSFESGLFDGSGLYGGSSSSAFDFTGAGSSFSLTNVTGYRMDSLIIRNNLNEVEIILLSKDKPIMNWEEKSFFCPMVGTEGGKDAEYTAEIQLENGTKFLLHDFPLGKSVKMLVVYEKNIGYLIYEKIKNNKMVSTMDNEKNLSGNNLVNSGNTYGEIQDPYNDYYQNPYADYDQPLVYVEPEYEAAPGQGSKDGCLDGGLFW